VWDLKTEGTHIRNPHKKKRKYKQKKLVMGSIDFSDIEKKPITYKNKPIEDWEVKDFVFWFADCLQTHFPDMPKYQVVYRRDCNNISTIKDAIEDGGFDFNTLKDFIQYAVEEQAQNIIDRKIETGVLAGFTTGDLIDLINPYMQQLIFSHKNPSDIAQDGIITISELQEQWDNNGLVGLLRNYGIPIAATYVVKTLDEDKDEIALVEKIKDTLITLDNNVLEKIAQQSVLRGPYSSQFKILEWQSIFGKIWQKTNVKGNRWWHKTYELDENRRWWFSL